MARIVRIAVHGSGAGIKLTAVSALNGKAFIRRYGLKIVTAAGEVNGPWSRVCLRELYTRFSGRTLIAGTCMSVSMRSRNSAMASPLVKKANATFVVAMIARGHHHARVGRAMP